MIETAARETYLSALLAGDVRACEALVDRLVGAGGRAMSEDNNRNFSRFMESLFAHYLPEVFADTALWVFRAYRAHGFRPIYWPANLDTWLERLRADLSPGTYAECAPFYEWLVVNIPAFTALTDAPADDDPLKARAGVSPS